MIQKKMGRTPVYLLLLLLLIGMLSGCGAPSAEEPAMETPVIEVPEIVIEKPLTDAPVYAQGDIITFGHYPQDGQEDPIEWIVLKQEGDSVLLVSRYGLECSRFWYDFSETDRDSWWERSDLRAMLNNPFYITAFSGDEQERMEEVTALASANSNHSTDQGPDTHDRVSCMDVEMLKYLDAENRTAMASSHAIMEGCNLYADGSWWWLRTMGEDGQHVCVVWADGEVDYDGVPMELDNGMVRPVIQIRAGS